MNVHDELVRLMQENPALVFDNDGYQQLHPSIVEAHKEPIAEIEGLLRQAIKGFVRFQNFKPRKDGSTAVRYQVHYNDEGSFTGVAYTPLENFK